MSAPARKQKPAPVLPQRLKAAARSQKMSDEQAINDVIQQVLGQMRPVRAPVPARPQRLKAAARSQKVSDEQAINYAIQQALGQVRPVRAPVPVPPPFKQPKKVAVKIPSKAELLAQFKVADKRGWHEGLGTANKLLVSLHAGEKMSVKGAGHILGYEAKRWLTDFFADKGGYYGAGYPKTTAEMWMQKVQGLKGILKYVAPLRPENVPQEWWAEHLAVLKAAISEINTQQELFSQIDQAVQGAKFSASSSWSAAAQIERLLDGTHDQEVHALVMRKVVAERIDREVWDAGAAQRKKDDAKHIDSMFAKLEQT